MPATARRSRAATAVAVLLLAGIFFVLRTDTVPGLALKFLVAKLVYSTSDAAALFLLGFAAIALLCRHLKLPEKWSAATPSLVWGGLLLGYGAHLAATLAYYLEHHIPFSAHVYQWSAGINSYTALLHSHLGKSAIALAVGTLSGAANYDTGSALAAAVPQPQAWLIGLGFIAATAGTLLWMPVFHARFGQRPALTAAWLIAAATATKSIFDGGLLAYPVLPALLLIGSFLFSRDTAAWVEFWRRRGWRYGSLILAAYLCVWVALTPESDIPLFGPWLFFIVILLLLATTAWRGIAAGLWRGVLIAYVLVNCTFDYGDNLAPLLRPVGPAHRAARFDVAGHGVAQPLDAWFGKPVFQAYRALGDDPWKPRRTLFWEVPAQGFNGFSAALRLLDWQGERGALTPTPALRLNRLAATRHGWLDIGIAADPAAELPPIFLHGSGNALSKNNYYVWLYQIDRMLRNAGWQSYILLPHTTGNVAPG